MMTLFQYILYVLIVFVIYILHARTLIGQKPCFNGVYNTEKACFIGFSATFSLYHKAKEA